MTASSIRGHFDSYIIQTIIVVDATYPGTIIILTQHNRTTTRTTSHPLHHCHSNQSRASKGESTARTSQH